MLRARAEATGLDDTRITAHSLRAGHATAAALADVPLDRIAAQTRHKDLTVLVNRYIRPLEALATTSSRDLVPRPRTMTPGRARATLRPSVSLKGNG